MLHAALHLVTYATSAPIINSESITSRAHLRGTKIFAKINKVSNYFDVSLILAKKANLIHSIIIHQIFERQNGKKL